MGNLPDISCLTLMKALFFMLGAFPSINSGGEIIPLFYTSLKDNVIAGNALDWSNKVTTQPSALPNKSAYNVSGFGQRNYYLMKNDNVDGDGSEDDTDVYASGIGIVYVGNEVIDRNKTIIQLPFYAPYIKNKKDPFRPTGNTMKFWYSSSGSLRSSHLHIPLLSRVMDTIAKNAPYFERYTGSIHKEQERSVQADWKYNEILVL